MGGKWSRLDEATDGIFWLRRGSCVRLTALSLAVRLWMACLGRTHVVQRREESKERNGWDFSKLMSDSGCMLLVCCSFY